MWPLQLILFIVEGTRLVADNEPGASLSFNGRAHWVLTWMSAQ